MAKCVTNMTGKIIKEVVQWTAIDRKYPLIGRLHYIQNGVAPCNVLVDNWPDFSTILTIPREGGQLTMGGHSITIHSKTMDPDPIRSMLLEPGVLPPQMTKRIYCLPKHLLPVVKDVIECQGQDSFSATETPVLLGYQPDQEVTDESIKSLLEDEFYVSPIDPDTYADGMTSLWRYWDSFHDSRDEAKSAVRHQLTHLPNSGVFAKQNDQLVAWMVTNLSGAFSMAHTIEEYRGRNIIWWAGLSIMARRQNNDWLGWGLMRANNRTAINSHIAVGGELGDTEYVHCTLKPKM